MIQAFSSPAASLVFAFVGLSGLLFGRSSILFLSIAGRKSSGVVTAIFGEIIAFAVLVIAYMTAQVTGFIFMEYLRQLIIVWAAGTVIGASIFFVLQIPSLR